VWSLSRMKRAFRSYREALRASRRVGRVQKLRRVGRPTEALAAAREGLGFLSGPEVIRDNPPEVSALVCLTIAVEQLAQELHEPGACERDLRDSYVALTDLGDSPRGKLREFRAAWLPYLEQRLGLPPSRET
jgi:hypothetical protein